MYACGIGRRIDVYACGIYAGICAQARVYGMYAAYMRLPMPHAYMRLPPPPEYAARIYVLGHRRVAALPTSASRVRKAGRQRYLPAASRCRSHSSDACLGTDVLLRYLRVHHACESQSFVKTLPARGLPMPHATRILPMRAWALTFCTCALSD
jgi:hypothetical protein